MEEEKPKTSEKKSSLKKSSKNYESIEKNLENEDSTSIKPISKSPTTISQNDGEETESNNEELMAVEAVKAVVASKMADSLEENEWEEIRPTSSKERRGSSKPSSGSTGSDEGSPSIIGLSSDEENNRKLGTGRFKTRKLSKKAALENTDSEHEEPMSTSDFGQEEASKQKKKDEEFMEKRGSWADVQDKLTGDEDEDDVGWTGGMKDLIGRSEAQKEAGEVKEDKPRRKRRRVSVSHKKEETTKKKKTKKEGVEEEEEEKVWIEPNYNPDDFISVPVVTEECTIPDTLCRFYFSYGYDSSRRSNLHVLDDDNVVYISGNYLHFYNIPDEKLVYIRRSASGYGLGHISVHPSRQYFAVGEKGHNPYIMIYTWPDLKVHRVLRKGTTRGYAYVNFNPSGELLCSLGMTPDFMLTIWNWEFEKIVLRYKAYSQDVFRATFSPTNPGDLTTCGLGHIRFWKMAETFTGLKLQGLIGRFGKTEISDIQDYCGLSDGKVISGSEWGNMLIWDYGLIMVEIVQKGGKTCHNGEISELKLQDAELLTIGFDGYLRIWESEILDLADTIVDDTGKFEVEPLYELRLSSTARLVSAVKSSHEEANIWFLQDAWGKVWSVNLTISMPKPDYQADTLFYTPGGGINGICVSPMYTVMAVGSQAGHLWLIEYINKECLARKVYASAVTKLLWLPLKYDPRGITLLAGFSDGTVRVLSIQMLTEQEMHTHNIHDENDTEQLPLIFWPVQILRYHKGAVLVMYIDQNDDILYCCGADKVIFGSNISWDNDEQRVYIEPLSYVTAPFPVISLDMHPVKNYRMIIASKSGRVAECRKPIWGDMDTSVTYNQGKLHGRRWFYKSVKSGRRRDERRENRKKDKEQRLEELYIDIQRRRELNIPVDEEIEIGRLNDQFRRQQQQDDEGELYIPPSPCPVLSIYYTINKNLAGANGGKTFFMHLGEYDAGYIYECKCTREEPGGFHPIPSTPPFTDDLGIRSYIISPQQNYLIFGMTDGTIRIMPKTQPPSRKKEDTGKTNKVERKRNIVVEEEDSDEENESGEKGESIISEMQKNKKKTKKVLPPFPVSLYPYDLKNFWALPMHDPDRGAVSALAFSFDSEFLFSTGDDGSIFAYRWDPKGKLASANDNLGQSIVPDIHYDEIPLEDREDSHALTLEELKKKSEDDRLFNLVDGKREVIRKELRKLKMDFRALVQRNSEIPEHQRVPRKKFEIDPRVRAPKQLKHMEEIEEVHKKLEWRSLKATIRCEKIDKYYLKDISTHHIVVKDLQHTTFVHTFRHRILTNKYWDIIEKNKTWMVEEDLLLNATMEISEKEIIEPPEPIKRFYAKDLIGNFEGKTYNIKTIHAIRQLENRLEKRYIRECEWAALNAQQILDDYEAPEDIKAIKWAQENMGDYKLRAGEDYIGERITIASRRERVLDIKKMIYDKLHQYNHYVILLKEEKQIVIEKCRELQQEIKQLQKYIPLNLRKPIPFVHDMEPIEKPENRYIITKEMIEARQEKKIAAMGFTKRRQAFHDKMYGATEDQNIQKKRKIRSIRSFQLHWRSYKFNCHLPDEPEIEKYKKQHAHMANSSKVGKNIKPPIGLATPIVVNEKASKMDGLPNSIFRYRKTFYNPKTSVAIDRRDRFLARRLLAQDALLEKLKGIIDYFKTRVTIIRDERTELSIDMKVAQLALMIRCEELDIVKEFDAAERGILDRLRAQRVELFAAKDRMDKVKKRLSRAKSDQDKIDISINAIQKEVAVVIGEKPKFSEYLWKVYKKKIKIEATEKSEEEAEMNGSTGSSSSGASGESTSQDSNSDLFRLPKQKLDTSICPDQLDKTIFERVCEFRTKRTQLEVEGDSQKRVVERIKKDFDEVEKVYKKFEGRLDGIGHEVNILQRQKQKRMNEINGLIIIRSDQIQCLDDDESTKELLAVQLSTQLPPGIELEDDEDLSGAYGRFYKQFPSDFTELLVFRKNEITKLIERTDELKEETTQEKQKQRGARHMMLRLQEEVRHKEKIVNGLVVKCQEDMRRKFGRTVDMDEVCACIINLEILDALLKLENRRNRHYYERHVIGKQIEETRRHLTSVTKVNSEFNTLLAILEERRRDVDYFLYKQKKEKPVKIHTATDITETSATTDPIRSNEDVEKQLYELEYQLLRQEMKIQILRETIAIAKGKTGIPPLISMHKIPDKYGEAFMTYDELKHYNHEINYQVETLYKKEYIMDHLQRSESTTPSFAGSPLVTDYSRLFDYEPLLDEPLDKPQLSIVEEEEEGQEPEIFFPNNEEFQGEDDYPYNNYTINILPDDQMLKSGDGTEYSEEETEYGTDPIPVAKVNEIKKKSVAIKDPLKLSSPKTVLDHKDLKVSSGEKPTTTEVKEIDEHKTTNEDEEAKKSGTPKE